MSALDNSSVSIFGLSSIVTNILHTITQDVNYMGNSEEGGGSI